MGTSTDAFQSRFSRPEKICHLPPDAKTCRKSDISAQIDNWAANLGVSVFVFKLLLFFSGTMEACGKARTALAAVERKSEFIPVIGTFYIPYAGNEIDVVEAIEMKEFGCPLASSFESP